MNFTPQNYLDAYNGQSLLYNTADASLRGQCVQGVCFFVTRNGHPVRWADATYWRDLAAMYPDQYEWVPNTAAAVPPVGALVIWNGNLPNSGGAGHIDVCLRPLPGTGTFIGVDTNWGGKTIHTVTHNYDYVDGWIIFKEAAPAPAPQPTPQGGDEMITSADQATKMYQLLRPNGQPSSDEVNGTAGHRSYAQFVNDAQPEVAARDNGLRVQNEQLANMQTLINQQNQSISDFTVKLHDETASNDDKQAALDKLLADTAATNAQLTTAHDTIIQCQTDIDNLKNAPKVVSTPGWLSSLLSKLFKKK